MIVLHVIFSLKIGGSESMLVDIINRQCHYATIKLIVVNEEVDQWLLSTIDRRVEVLLIKRPIGSINPLFFVKLNVLIVRIAPSVIHCHDHNLIAGIVGKRGKTHLTVHDVGKVSTHFSKYQKLFAISRSVQEDLQSRYGVTSILIYNGINFDSIRSGRQENKQSKIRIVQIARLEHLKKRQDLVVYAIKELVFDYGIKNITVDFIGEGLSLAYLEKLVKENELSGYINFKGAMLRKDVYQVLPEYDIMLHPSQYEGFGLCIVEGLAAGLSVVATEGDGPEEILQVVNAGYTIPKNSVKDIVEKIRSIVNGYSSTEVRRIADRRIVERHFDVNTTAIKYIENY